MTPPGSCDVHGSEIMPHLSCGIVTAQKLSASGAVMTAPGSFDMHHGIIMAKTVWHDCYGSKTISQRRGHDRALQRGFLRCGKTCAMGSGGITALFLAPHKMGLHGGFGVISVDLPNFGGERNRIFHLKICAGCRIMKPIWKGTTFALSEEKNDGI